jgi:hypothetical protein
VAPRKAFWRLEPQKLKASEGVNRGKDLEVVRKKTERNKVILSARRKWNCHKLVTHPGFSVYPGTPV